MVLIGSDTYEDLTAASFEKVLDELAAGRKPKPGPQIERQLSAPVGRFHVQLCGTTPCRLRGADDLEKLCRSRIGEQGEVTEDGKFSWVEVECLGACVNAPMVQINSDYYEDLTGDSFGKILDQLAAGKKVKPGPQVDRQLSAPIGGPITLTDASLYERRGKSGMPHEPKDGEAKKPGAAANFRSGAPTSPAQDQEKPKPN